MCDVMDYTIRELRELESRGADHRALINAAKKGAHHGFDEAEDGSLCVFYYPDGIIMIVPYGRIVPFCYGHKVPVTPEPPNEDPEDRFLRLCRAAGAQLEADNKAAYERYSATLREIEKEFSSGAWPWYKI